MARRKKDPPPSFATDKPTWDRNHYVMMFDDQLNSPAYRALTAHAKEAYMILRQEYTGPYSGSKVICPYSTFQKKGMRANTLSRALLQLEIFGFIEIDRGGLEHRPSIYHFIGDWKKIKTQEDVKEAADRMKNQLERKKKAKDLVAEERLHSLPAPYGKYISSNESDSYADENAEENANESDSILQKFLGMQQTEALAKQVAEPLVAEEPTHYQSGPASRVH